MDFVSFLIEASNTLVKLKPTDARIYMLRKYETKFGIFNHDAGRDPNALPELRMHWEENRKVNSRMKARRDAYVKSKVNKWFGYTFSEFLSLTRQELIETLNEAERFSEEERRDQHAQAMALQQQLAGTAGEKA